MNQCIIKLIELFLIHCTVNIIRISFIVSGFAICFCKVNRILFNDRRSSIIKMKIITTISELSQTLREARHAAQSVGIVPTMGALHEGHASLVSRSVKENDITVVSVFVNPTQFNDPTDLASYPRTPEADCRLLENLGVDVVFTPTVEEITRKRIHAVSAIRPLTR